jgi:hypothetical protein
MPTTTVTAPTFNQVDGVGLWLQAKRTSSGSGPAQLIFNNFEAVMAPAIFASWGEGLTSPYMTGSASSLRGFTSGAHAIAYSNTTPLSPSSNYTGPTFYGGIDIRNPNNSGGTSVNGFTYARISLDPPPIVDGDPNEGMYFNLIATGNPDDVISALVVFKKADFINSFSPSTTHVKFDDFSTLRCNARKVSATIPGNVRFVVEQGGSFYISDPCEISNVKSDFFLSPRAYALANGVWHSYSPTTDITVIGSAVTTPSFTNVDSVGMLLQSNRALDTTGTLQLTFNAFRAETTTKP